MTAKEKYHRGVSEAFGFRPDVQSNEGQECWRNYQCPYLHRRCVKRSQHRGYDAAVPFGACSVWHRGEGLEQPAPYIICPFRFLEDDRIFQDARGCLPSREGCEAFVVPAVNLPLGRLDYVLCAYDKRLASVVDFVVMEVMACSTTSTGDVLRSLHAILKGRDTPGPLKYGINFRQVISRMAVQGVVKAQTCGFWGKPLIWVIQDVLYTYITSVTRLDLSPLPTDSLQDPSIRPAIMFLIYTLTYEQPGPRFRLRMRGALGGTLRDFSNLVETKIHLRPERLAQVLGERIKTNDRVIPLV